MAATKTKTTTPAAVGKANTLELTAEPGKTIERQMADVVGSGLLGNASVMRLYAAGIFGELDITECARALKASVGAVKAGDLSAAEGMLMTQAVALNAIFGELARRAASNMGEYPDAFERYMRLAFKSQAQCRATIETLATIKNPPVMFARQANINNGGQQQVNNGSVPNVSPPIAHAGETASRQNELLEDRTHGSTQLDSRATAPSGQTNQGLEPVGAVNRTAKR